MISTPITIVGNLAADPELRYTPTGVPMCTFRVGVTSRIKKDGSWTDGNVSWFRCTAWRQMAESCVESLSKGTRVIVTGSLENREYTDREGAKRTSLDIEVDDCGPSLTFTSAKIHKAERDTAGVASKGAGADDPWINEPDTGTPF